MDDFEKSFQKCKIEESSGHTENMTASDTESISLTPTLTTTPTKTPTTILTDGIHNDGDNANTEEWGLGTNVYMTST